MGHCGTIAEFDLGMGFGTIKPDAGGDALRFESTAMRWDGSPAPKAQQRFSYDHGTNYAGKLCAVNLRAI
jgi:CspA family cold shock protein